MKKKTKLGLTIFLLSLTIIITNIPIKTASNNIYTLMLALLNPNKNVEAEHLLFLDSLFQLFFPWFIFLAILWSFSKLLSSARKRKSGVVVLASFIQMFLPDPLVDQTIKVKTEQLEIKESGVKETNKEQVEAQTN